MDPRLRQYCRQKPKNDSIIYLGTIFHSHASRTAKQNLHLHIYYTKLLELELYDSTRTREKTRNLPPHMLNWAITKTMQKNPDLEQKLKQEFADRGF